MCGAVFQIDRKNRWMTVTFTFDRPSHVSQDKVEQHQNALPWLRGGKVALVTPHPHELQVELVSMTTGNKIWCLLIPRYPPFAVENVPYFVQKSMQAHFCRSDRASQGLAKFTKKCKKNFYPVSFGWEIAFQSGKVYPLHLPQKYATCQLPSLYPLSGGICID